MPFNIAAGTGGNNIDEMLCASLLAFREYKHSLPEQRALLLETIAASIEAVRDDLVFNAGSETNLPAARLNGEITRTTSQLKLFANLLREGSWVEAAIDTQDTGRVPPKPDTRKMLIPVGPVAVFGASNFPFAFSTAGGDTASALAAGCSVIIKAHPAHLQTSTLVFSAIQKALNQLKIPLVLVQHLIAKNNEEAKELVQHPYTSAVGFTGSFAGGNALIQYAHERHRPIPVFAEMSSVNPVLFLPDAINKNAPVLAQQYAASVALGSGQFCTNPGILIAFKNSYTDKFIYLLAEELSKMSPAKMLHKGIHENYNTTTERMLALEGIKIITDINSSAKEMEPQAILAKTDATSFLSNTHFTEEVFGPFTLMVECSTEEEIKAVLWQLQGQLTATTMCTENDITVYKHLIEYQQQIAGRVIINNVPTGVEVCASMVHGGPYPATSFSHFTSVGSAAIKRWTRPVCFQNYPDDLLPDALKNNNPLGIWRIINNEWTNKNI